MSNVLITGGSGLVGGHLTRQLLSKGYTVAHLGRSMHTADAGIQQFIWDPSRGLIDPKAIEQADVIVHLAGAGVADKRWTADRKQLIIDSRVTSAQLLVNEIKRQQKKLSAFVSASATGWYGMTNHQHECEEDEPAYPDFFGDCCKYWEESVDPITTMNIRLVKLRIGIVLAREGGFLPQVAAPVKLFAGAILGSGKQWTPWIHIDDVCAMFIQAIEQKTITGVYNVVGPQPSTNQEITKAIGRALHRPIFLPPVPEFILNILFGEMAKMLVTGNRISNKRIVDTGFRYAFPNLESALSDLLN
jgi:hypothetical protein